MKMAIFPKFPDVEVQLSGEDGNAMFIIGRVRAAMRRAGVSQEQMDAFSSKAMSGNYDNVLRTCMEYVTVN